MIDPRLLRDDPDRVRAAQAKRGLSDDVVDRALAADSARRQAIADFEAKRAELIDEYEQTLANPYIAAERGYVDAVIHPHETRSEVVRALRLLRTKRESLPPKKHGNIPL